MQKTVKSQVEVLNKLIEQFEDRARWAEADGNISVAQYNNGLAEGLRRVRNGDLSHYLQIGRAHV